MSLFFMLIFIKLIIFHVIEYLSQNLFKKRNEKGFYRGPKLAYSGPKPNGFLMFSGGIEKQHLAVMG